ncbi:MAG: ion channel [Pseudomonadota bacterium]
MESLITASIAAFLVGLCVLLHFEALNLFSLCLPPEGGHFRRLIVVYVLGLIVVHIVEIWLFGLGIWAMVDWLGIGSILGGAEGVYDFVYFSAMIYTTVGFGDLVPEGPLRLLVGTEALAGLSLITWSASYTFFLMQRIWQH